MTVDIFVSNMTDEHSMLIFGKPNPLKNINGRWFMSDPPISAQHSQLKFNTFRRPDGSQKMLLGQGSVQTMIKLGYLKGHCSQDREDA